MGIDCSGAQPINQMRARVVRVGARAKDSRSSASAQFRLMELELKACLCLTKGDSLAMANKKVRVAIAGVGNCATSLIQGVEYYKDTPAEEKIPGLMHVQFGDYHVSDVEFVAAFDVDADKVGKDLAEATEAGMNCTIKIADVPNLGVTVQRGPTYDGLGQHYLATIEESQEEPVDVAQVLRDNEVDVLVSYLPVGSEEADKYYAQAAIDAGCALDRKSVV